MGGGSMRVPRGGLRTVDRLGMRTTAEWFRIRMMKIMNVFVIYSRLVRAAPPSSSLHGPALTRTGSRRARRRGRCRLAWGRQDPQDSWRRASGCRPPSALDRGVQVVETLLHRHGRNLCPEAALPM